MEKAGGQVCILRVQGSDGTDPKVRRGDKGLLLQQKGLELNPRQTLPSAHQREKGEASLFRTVEGHNMLCSLPITSREEFLFRSSLSTAT